MNTTIGKFDALNSVLYQQHTGKLKSSIKSDPSIFWSLVKSKRKVDCIPKLLQNGSRSSIDEKEQAKMFAEFFNENFNPMIHARRPTTNLSSVNEPLLLDEYFVFDKMMKMKTAVSCGSDGIHPLVLKNCASILYVPITLIFNDSLQSGVFPEVWKR